MVGVCRVTDKVGSHLDTTKDLVHEAKRHSEAGVLLGATPAGFVTPALAA